MVYGTQITIVLGLINQLITGGPHTVGSLIPVDKNMVYRRLPYLGWAGDCSKQCLDGPVVF